LGKKKSKTPLEQEDVKAREIQDSSRRTEGPRGSSHWVGIRPSQAFSNRTVLASKPNGPSNAKKNYGGEGKVLWGRGVVNTTSRGEK